MTAHPGTATTSGARDHARAQGATVVETMPTIPASAYPHPPAGVSPSRLTWAETIAAGGYSSKVLARGSRLRLTDVHGQACAHLLIYNADQPWERLNVADTVKIPWQAYLGTGHPLLSDQGRVLAIIRTDTTGGSHDALAGASTLVSNTARYGDGAAQSPTPAARELLKLAAAKHDLTPRDVPPSISLFKRVRVGPDGALDFTATATAGASVEITAELPLIVLIANAPHRLDPRPAYTCGTLGVLAWRDAPTRPDDALWTATPELNRALLNSADYADARGIA